MKDQEPKAIPQEAKRQSRLPEKTRGFVQLAFAHGAADKLDERRKWLLARYVVEDKLTLDGLKKYAGVTTAERARQIYNRALHIIWEASPAEVQQRFPKEEVIHGKLTYQFGRKLTPEARERIRAGLMRPEVRAKRSATQTGRKLAQETIEKIRETKKGHVVSLETREKIRSSMKGRKLTPEAKENMRAAQQKRRKREKKNKTEEVLYVNSQTKDK